MQDLVLAAQHGNQEAFEALWLKVKRLAAWISFKYASAAKVCSGVSREDLFQCAALGAVEAVHSYKPEKGPFEAWMGGYIRNACRACLGLRGRKREEHFATISLDAPVKGAEDLTVGDCIEDELSRAAFEDVETQIDLELLRRDLAAALSRLPPEMREPIQQHDLDGEPLRPDQVQPRQRGLRQLRRDRTLTPYVPNYHRHKGLAAFRTTWSSIVEDEVIKKLDRHA